MKKTIVIAFLALIAMVAQSKTFKTIKNPVAIAHNIMGGELKAREVIFKDTATTVHFTMKYPKEQSFQFLSSSYLMDEDGNRYPLLSAEKLELNAWVKSPESGIMEFTMHFKPLPKRTMVFDFIESDLPESFKLLGIHDKNTELKIPTLQELSTVNPWIVPADWFNTDTITIKGRIEDYDAELFGFTAMECFFKDVFEKDDATLVLDIASDGSFLKKFQASYPVHLQFHAEESRIDFNKIPFFARPGETIDITIKKNKQDRYACVYNNGSSRDVERWLRSSDEIISLLPPLSNFQGNFKEENALANTIWQKEIYCLNAISRREHYTPMEIQLALADMQAHFAEDYLSYAMLREHVLKKQGVRDGVYYIEILDSMEWQNLLDEQQYYILNRIDFDNPLLLISSEYPYLLNRMQYAIPVHNSKFKDLIDKNGVVIDRSAEEWKKAFIKSYVALKELIGSNHNNMTVQLAVYKDMQAYFNTWRNNEDKIGRILADTTATIAEREEHVAKLMTLSNMMPTILSLFTLPYIKQKAEQFYAHKMAQLDLSSPLPDTPATDFIHSLSTKYPDKLLIIDFWGMNCAPCRSAIQNSKQKRVEIAKRNDVKLIFIAGERSSEGSDAYKAYVAEWLAEEETFCFTYTDFTRFQELFQFNGIPHYETIAPDGRRVRDDLKINGFYNFDNELENLLEKLK